jgi:type 1 glutamine amidotransferase
LFAGWPAALRGRAAAANHSITVGLGDFDLVTEQYLVLADEDIEVLATTTQPVRDWDPWHRAVTSPLIWTRRWGSGRIFVAARSGLV